MKVIFLTSFKKDLQKISSTKLKVQIIELIELLEESKGLNEIPNLKKLKGYPFAYRIRIGNYRLGVFIEDNTIELTRFVKRNDIYKVFP